MTIVVNVPYSEWYSEAPSGVLLDSVDFSGGTVPPTWTVQNTNGIITLSDGALTCNYPSGTTRGQGLYCGAINGQSEVFIKVVASMSDLKGGTKFTKIQGQETTNNYANATFGLKNGTGFMSDVSFGDGSIETNDTANFIDFSDGTVNGRNDGIATISCPNGVWDWPDELPHEFLFHWKQNSGTTSENEINDGEFHVFIDGDLYCAATNLFNRHYSNLPMEYLEMLTVSQSEPNAYTIVLNEVELSTGDWI